MTNRAPMANMHLKDDNHYEKKDVAALQRHYIKTMIITMRHRMNRLKDVGVFHAPTTFNID